MDFITELWLPIVLSAIAVFFASSILWMALPLHKNDFTEPPNEDAICDAVKTHNFKPGQYYIPWCQHGKPTDESHKERLESYKARLDRGPWAMLIVMPKAPNFGRSLGQWFVYNLIITTVIAYVAAAALPMNAGIEYLKVFQVVGTVALLAYAGSSVCDCIWKGVPWRIAMTQIIDGLVYALLLGGIFGWLWPNTPIA